MKRLLLILGHTATILCCMLVLVIAVLWVRGHLLISDFLAYHSSEAAQQRHTEISLQSLDGAISFRWLTAPSPQNLILSNGSLIQTQRDPVAGLYYFTFQYPPDAISYRSLWNRLGFALAWPVPASRSFGVVAIPDWLLLVVCSLFPLLRLGAIIRRWQRRRRGLCTACGYDLRSSPNQCPECGAVPEGVAT